MIGMLLGNRYEILKQIGDGGMAKVYKAKCQLLNRFVAIKVLKDEFQDNEEFIRKFKRESLAAASIAHQNIVGVFDVGEEVLEDGRKIYYIVMEYVEGQTLKAKLNEIKRFNYNDALDIFIQIGEALSFAHSKGVIHRDIKPQNILITDDGQVKVTDFGIARATTSMTMTATTDVLGSVHYFSPEQARGGYTDEKSDIYSFGIVMYEMITGALPFDGDSPISVALKHINESVPSVNDVDSTIDEKLSVIIAGCTNKIQSDRFSSVDAVLAELKKLRGNTEKELVELDDGRTMLISGSEIEQRISADSEKNRKMKKADVKKETVKKPSGNNGGIKSVILGILCAFILVAVLFVGYNKIKDKFSQPSIKTVAVPEFVGKTFAEAEDLAAGVNISVEQREIVNNENYGPGQIVFQSVEPETQVKTGYTVYVDVNSDQAIDVPKIPKLIHQNIESAKEMIIDAGFVVGEVREEASETIPAGYVINQNPAPDTVAKKGDRVDLLISSGLSIQHSTVPSLIGLTVDEARSELHSRGLLLGEAKPQEKDDVEPGKIFWQDKSEGSSVEAETPVSVYYNSKTEEKNKEENEDNKNNTSSDVITNTMLITPVSETEAVYVEVIKIENGEETIIFAGNRNVSDGDFSVEVSGRSGTQIQVFFDGVLQGTSMVLE